MMMRTDLPRVRLIVDTVSASLLVIVAGFALGPAHGDLRLQLALGLGALVGLLAGLVPVLLRWPGWLALPIAVVGYFLFGAAAAVPSHAIGGVLPSPEALRLLAVGVLSSWKQLLTVEVPVGSSGSLLLPAYLLALVLTTAAVLIVTRTRWPTLALLPVTLMAAGAAILGTQGTGLLFDPRISGAVLVGLGLVWAGWSRSQRGKPGLDLRRPIALAAALVPALAAGVLVAPMLAGTEGRLVARELVTPPPNPQVLPSPLAGYRAFLKSGAEKVLFRVSGLPAETPVRMAVLDDYNGRYYLLSEAGGSFRRVGEKLAMVPAGTRATVDIRVGDYRDLWVPMPGYLQEVSFGGPEAGLLQDGFRYNREAAAAVMSRGLQAGDEYRMTVSVPSRPSLEQLKGVPVEQITLPTPQRVPPEVSARAQEWVGGATDPAEKVERIRAKLFELGFVSHGEDRAGVPAGHGADRIRQLLSAKVMYGDAEQFAVAMALMVRAQGMPARVVMGFKGQPQGGAVDLTGAMMTAWVEVPFQGYGWVAFDPNPLASKTPPQPKAESQGQADPRPIQPPPAPQPPKDPEAQSVDEPTSATQSSKPPKPEEQEQDQNPSTIRWGLIAAIAGGLFLLLLPFLLILLLKRRRRSRHAAGTPEERIAGAWAHLMDVATDYGKRPHPGLTRAEVARAWAASFVAGPGGAPGHGPKAEAGGGGVAVLARTADNKIFAPDPVAPEEASAYWKAVDAEISSLRGTQGFWRRLRAMLSLKSLRRRD